MTLRARSWLFLAALGVAAAILAGLLSRGVPLQTNVLAMLPATERDPVAEKVVASLGAAIGSRVLILVSHADEARAKAAAERFAAVAGGSGGLRALTDAPARARPEAVAQPLRRQPLWTARGSPIARRSPPAAGVRATRCCSRSSRRSAASQGCRSRRIHSASSAAGWRRSSRARVRCASRTAT